MAPKPNMFEFPMPIPPYILYRPEQMKQLWLC